MSGFCNGRGTLSFDWNTTWSFTPCFEETFLVATPALIVLAAAWPSISSVGRKSIVRDGWSAHAIIKLLFTIAYFGSIVALWFVNFTNNLFSTILGHAFYGVTALSLVFVFYIQYLQHWRSKAASALLFLFWGLSLIFNAMRVRTSYITGSNTTIQILLITITALSFLSACLENVPERVKNTLVSSELKTSAEPEPELRRSLLSSMFFTWVFSILRVGLRRTLDIDDLRRLEDEYRASQVARVFEDEAAKLPEAKRTLGRIVWKAFGLEYTYSGLVRLVWILITATIPQVNSSLFTFIGSYSKNSNGDYITTPLPVAVGLYIAGTLLLLSVAQNLLNAHFTQMNAVVGFKVRLAVMDAVYKKVFRVKRGAAAASNPDKPEENLDVNNLISMDALRMTTASASLHFVWSLFVEFSVFLYFLYQICGLSAFMAIPVMIIGMIAITLVGKRQMRFEMATMAASDKRISFITEMIRCIKTIKLYAWEPFFDEKVMKHREDELAAIKNSRWNVSFLVALTTALQPLLMLAIIAVYAALNPNKNVTANIVFVALNYIKYMTDGLHVLSSMSSELSGSYISFQRLSRYLSLPERDLSHIRRSETFPSGQTVPAVAISIENASFSIDGSSGQNAKNFEVDHLAVAGGSLLAIVGTVGSGKSTLLRAVLGELECIKGQINIHGNGSIGYVPQEAWIFNGTIRENITAFYSRGFDKARYEAVIRACALTQDLQSFTDGDETEIGARGINLSGGQKQRISIARAAYSDSSIIFFDDPLSAVDAHVNKHIFQHVLGPSGLLKDRTRVLVTHSIQHLPRANYVAVMHDGKIDEQGTFEGLMTAKGRLYDLMTSEGISMEADLNSDLDSITSTVERKSVMETETKDSSSDIEKRDSDESDKPRSSGELTIASPTSGKMEKSEAGKLKSSVYLGYAKSLSYVGLAIGSALLMILVGLTNGSQFWLSRWTDDAQGSQSAFFYVGIYAAFALGMVLGDAFAAFYIMATLGVRSSKVLMKKVLVALLRSPMSFYDTTPTGQIINRFAGDFIGIDHILPAILYTWAAAAFMTIGGIVTITIVTPYLLAVFVPASIIAYFVRLYYVSSSRELKRLDASSKSPIFNLFSESAEGMLSISAFGYIDAYRAKSFERMDVHMKAYYWNISVLRWLQLSLDLLGGSLTLFSAALFGVLARETLSPSLIGVSINTALQISFFLQLVVRGSVDLETNLIAMERVNEYVALPSEAPEIVPKDSDLDGKGGGGSSALWPQRGEIIFEGVELRYRSELPLVLKGLNLSIKAGEKVGVVGRTGAGKSSLMMALFRLVEPSAGTISIDKVAHNSVGLRTLRSRITAIPQDAQLFTGSVRDNLWPTVPGGETRTDAQMWAALEKADLKTTIEAMSGKLDAEVTQNGDNFSAGQRQLFCMARAFLKGGSVFILDEATAAIDLATDTAVREALKVNLAESTVLTIAHRINTILESDRVIVLDKGTILEMDTPAALLAMEDSVFRALAVEAGAV